MLHNCRAEPSSWLVPWLAAAAIVALPTLPAVAQTTSPCPNGAINVAAGSSIQQAVNKAKAKAVFCLKNGTHRMQVVQPKQGQQFYGEGKTILNGSRELTKFTRSGSHWVTKEQKLTNRRSGDCGRKFPTCNFVEVVFINDKPLGRALNRDDLAPGLFYYDAGAASIYLADNPRNKTVEVTISQYAFFAEVSDVVIDNVTIEKYANPAQNGAIDAQYGPGWQIRNCEVRMTGGAGISVGTDTTVKQCKIHNNGQIGITGAGHNIHIEGNTVWTNNTRGFSHGWESGGIKISLANDTIFRGNHVYDNRGPGIWCDGHCRRAIYEDNRVVRNDDAGIYHEISYQTTIRNNIVRNNGRANEGWFWDAEILIAGSEGAEIHNNRTTSKKGACGIMLIDQGRLEDDGYVFKTRNNNVHSNVMTFVDAPCAGGVSDVSRGDANYGLIENGNNRFNRNTYRVPKAARNFRFVWGQREDIDWAEFRSLGQEANGRMVRY